MPTLAKKPKNVPNITLHFSRWKFSPSTHWVIMFYSEIFELKPTIYGQNNKSTLWAKEKGPIFAQCDKTALETVE